VRRGADLLRHRCHRITTHYSAGVLTRLIEATGSDVNDLLRGNTERGEPAAAVLELNGTKNSQRLLVLLRGSGHGAAIIASQ
jgi:hypothetical protein